MSKYKYPKASAGRIRLMHPAMKPFESLPLVRVHPWYQFVAIGVFFAIMVLAMVVMTIGHWEKGLNGLMIVVIAFLIAIPTFYQIIVKLHRMLMIRQANEDRQAFKATPEERPIGIAYCDHVWAFRDDTSWDRGFVRIEDNCLCFRGFGPEFQLPLESIQDTWIAMQATVLDQSPPTLHQVESS